MQPREWKGFKTQCKPYGRTYEYQGIDLVGHRWYLLDPTGKRWDDQEAYLKAQEAPKKKAPVKKRTVKPKVEE